jgi:hypothetical protein
VSFQPSNTGFSVRQIRAFTADADHAATVYVGVVNDKQSGGVFVSHTGGLSWKHLNDGLDGHDVFSLGQAPDGTILAGTEHGIFRLKESLWLRVGGDTKTAEAPVVARTALAASSGKKVTRKMAARAQAGKVQRAVAIAPLKNFDGSVYGFALTGETLFAATSEGVLRSASSGLTWSLVTAIQAGDWHFVAAAKDYVVAASLNEVEMSADGGRTWQAVALPPKVTQVAALSLDGQGEVWIGDRDGVYLSADKGANWQTLTNLYVRNVNSLYYDEPAKRMLVTTNEPATAAFAVEIPSMRVDSWDTKWNLRFVRPVGDYLLGATLFDGVVVQPRMVDSALVEKP